MMRWIFEHRWISSLGLTIIAAMFLLLVGGELSIGQLILVFVLAALALSYPEFQERTWQRKHLPPGTIHVPVSQIKTSGEIDLMKVFLQPSIYQVIKNRYSLKAGDNSAPGIFLYIYLPVHLYEERNIGPDTVYRRLAEKLKEDLKDAQDLDMIAQRFLPLAFGYRFLPKNDYKYHEHARTINVVRKEYFRENTKIKGILQSGKRVFRMHAGEDAEWRTFLPYQDETQVLHGGSSVAHDFRSMISRKLGLNQAKEIPAERVQYPEPLPFGSLLTYAKKGEIVLEGAPEASDKLYIDRINVLVHGSENRAAILQQIGKALGREIMEEDFYPLFNYGQKLRGYMSAGKSLTDFVSSRGNFAIYYDQEKGWTILRLEPSLRLELQEAYWSRNPVPLKDRASLTTSRASILVGSHDSVLKFNISTGTPTRGQILSADAMIEQKMDDFARANGLKLTRQIGSSAEGCLFLAERNGTRYYVKSPDGQLAAEELRTIDELKQHGLISTRIQTFPEERVVVMPEFPSVDLPIDGKLAPAALIFLYLKRLWENGYLCLDLTPDHVRIDPKEQKLFLIDFAGYASQTSFRKNPSALVQDRKKIEYQTPEEHVRDFRDVEKFQIYLLGLLLYQSAHPELGLPFALTHLKAGSEADYNLQLTRDIEALNMPALPLRYMLAYDPKQRKSFAELAADFVLPPQQLIAFWSNV